MKISNCKYISNEEREQFLKNINFNITHASHIIQQCSIIIIKKDDVNYILKDRWKDPFISEEENINKILKYNFIIMSKIIFDKIKRLNSLYNIIQPSDKLIIDCD